MNTLQFAIDLGRTIAHTEHAGGLGDVREKARNIVEALGLPLDIDTDVAFNIGLGYGLRDRRETPIDEAARELMGQVEFKD